MGKENSDGPSKKVMRRRLDAAARFFTAVGLLGVLAMCLFIQLGQGYAAMAAFGPAFAGSLTAVFIKLPERAACDGKDRGE